MEWIFWTILVLSITIYKIIARYFEYKEKIIEEINEYGDWGSDSK